MAKKASKTNLQNAYEEYALKSLAPQITRLYTVPVLGLDFIDAEDSKHADAMAELVFSDENLIERAKETYRLVLKSDIAARFLPDQQLELEESIDRLVKNYGISLTKARTNKRRENQVCRTFDIGLYPNATAKKQLARKRLEAKWMYNDLVEHGTKGYDTSKTTVQIYNSKEEKYFPRKYENLTSRERQGFLKQFRSSTKGLATSKSKGRKVGKLKFKSRIDTIPLDQYGITHYICDDKKHVHIAGVDGDIYARGLDQLDKDWEPTVAKLMWLGDGFHLKITAYKDKEKLNETYHMYRMRRTVSTFDLGVHHQLTFADNTTIDLLFENSATWRALDRKMSAQQKGSRSREKTKAHRRKAALRDSYAKDDAANKVCALISKSEICITQDDRIDSWRRRNSFAHGSKKIHHGIIGRVVKKLRDRGGVYMLDSWTPTTQVCPRCHEKTKHGLDEQGNIICSHCGFEYPRNAGAAWSMEYAAIQTFKDSLPAWFVPIEVSEDVDETLALARKRSAWTEDMTYNIDDPRVLDAILGHVDDKSHVGEDMSGRVRPREKDGWESKKETRGKEDKWAKYSKNYDRYVRKGEEPQHAEQPVEKVSSRETEEGHRRHNKVRSRSRADRRAYRWSNLKRKRRAKERERCEKRDKARLAKQKKKEVSTKNNDQCTLGTRGINAGGDGQKPLRVCRNVSQSRKPEAATSGTLS